MQHHCTLYKVLPLSRDFNPCPEPTIEIPNQVFKQVGFQSKIAGVLVGANIELLTDRLRGVGHPIQPKCIIKRVSVRRSLSKLWFFVRVAVQLSLDRSPLGHDVYKVLMLLFMYNLAVHAVSARLPGSLLYSMSSKILRRFRKLGSSVPQWLRDPVLRTCISLSRTLDERRQDVQYSPQSSLNWDPSLLDVAKDVQHSLPHIHDYLSRFLAENDDGHIHTPLLPNSRPRGTLNDFLSDPTWLPKGRDDDDAHVTLYDVERAVGEEIGSWVACVTNVDEACGKLDRLAHKCHSLLKTISKSDHLSIMLLTIIELWVALDKLVTKEIPILADYSPEVPLDFLHELLLRDATSLLRSCRAYQYLFARHTQAHPEWRVSSNEITEYSFPCRYYDHSPALQRPEARAGDTSLSQLHHKAAVFKQHPPASFVAWDSVTQVVLDATREVSCLYRSRPYAASGLQAYLDSTTHTANQILAAQTYCDPNLSLDTFIAFAHLRCGGSLQWFNILRELRSRNLDFRREEVYLLFAQASAQVGSLDNTGKLLWHQELQDVSFCHALLGELENLFIDIGVGSLDGPGMAIVSLLAGVIASGHSQDTSERAIKLLRDVRCKTFRWVHELLYEARKSSPSNVGLKLLRDMAAVCRNTFNVGSTTSQKLLCSAQDIEIVLSCSMLIRTTHALFPGMSDPELTVTSLTFYRQMSLRIRECSWNKIVDSLLFSRGI